MQNPTDIHAEFIRAFNAGDASALLALYEPEAVFVPQPGVEARGLAEIAEALKPYLESGMKIAMTTAFVIESGDLALMAGEWVLTGGPDGLKGKSSEVVRRGADGGWRYILDNPWSA